VARAGLIANSAAVVAVAATALALSVGAAAAADRCCFHVQAAVSGHALTTNGPDLEHPGASAYRARWRWSVRHVARYVEHGRIFNALTAPRLGKVTKHRFVSRLGNPGLDTQADVQAGVAPTRRRARRPCLRLARR
jgi:hypothetical protein